MSLGGVLLVIFLVLKEVCTDKFDPASQQLQLYKKTHPLIKDSLTTSNGEPVLESDSDNSFGYKSLINDENFMDIITHLDRERIPERVIHAKGAGARGYFEVTNDITDICKADFLSEIKKKTDVFVRFSSVVGERGSSDADRDDRGFSVKFYTREGNWDFVGINLPVFVIKDPLKFSTFLHSVKKNPVTNLLDDNQVWDFITRNNESLFIFSHIYTDLGVPLSYRYMPGHSVHTYQVENKTGHYSFGRFIFLPELGIRNLTIKQAKKVGCDDANHLTRDLYNAIGEGEYPSWILYIQEVKCAQIETTPFDPFDITRILPTDLYPLRPIGRLVLNKNPENYFAEVEQVAFCPGNLVPGILGAPDQLFQARRFSYRDSQFHRLGSNFRKIAVNCPFATKVRNYLRDGDAPVLDNGRDAPNYFPNSFNGPVPRVNKYKPKLIDIKQTKAYNLDQLSDFINGLTKHEFETVIANIIYSLNNTYTFLQHRAINLLTSVNVKLGNRVSAALHANVSLNNS